MTTPCVLILGGTSEASALAQAMAARGIKAVFSYAGRVATPRVQPLPTRVGGFGGVAGLTQYLLENGITHVVDATHPFASGMSHNAVAACSDAGVALVALTRPAWQTGPGDNWQHVADIDAAIGALDGPPRRVFLALGRMHLAQFAARPAHHYVVRLVDQPVKMPLPNCTVIVARGPFDVAGDRGLIETHRIDLILCKNAGGQGAKAKLTAARALGVPVVMIDRPAMPNRVELSSTDQVLDWLGYAGAPNHPGADLGV